MKDVVTSEKITSSTLVEKNSQSTCQAKDWHIGNCMEIMRRVYEHCIIGNDCSHLNEVLRYGRHEWETESMVFQFIILLVVAILPDGTDLEHKNNT